VAEQTKLDYNKRTFLEIKTGLENYVKKYYPDSFKDFTENDLGILFIELMAGSSEILSFNTDRAFQETQLDNAQQRKSILGIAKNLGVKIPNKRASVTMVDFSVKVPAKGDTFATEYLPIIKAGTQVTGGGKVFELLEDIDFSSNVSNNGVANRLIIPNLDASELVQNYTITKREIVYNGATKIFNRTIRSNDFKPFFEIILPDTNVIEIDSIINLNGTNNATPSLDSFYDDDLRFFEVDYLLQDRIFLADNNLPTDQGSILKPAKWKKIKRKFIKEFTDKSFCKITFGGGNGQIDLFQTVMSNNGIYNGLDGYLQNSALGEIPSIDTQIFVKYRVGGGSTSNLGANTLTTLGNINLTVNGSDSRVNQQVIRSLTVNNPIPALGGADAPSIEDIRNMISYNYSAQDRCITLNDYLVRIFQMPGKFGGAFKSNVYKIDNKISIKLLGINPDGTLNNTSNNILKENMAEYLSQYRSMNDYVEIDNGQIINLSTIFTLFIDEHIPSNQIALNAITTIKEYFNILNSNMNEDINLSNLIENVNNVKGVNNIIDYKFYNLIGNGYSLNEINQPYIDETTREIKLINNTLYSSMDSMFEIKNPEKNIKLILKKKNQLLT
jgi:hypothetical protein